MAEIQQINSSFINEATFRRLLQKDAEGVAHEFSLRVVRNYIERAEVIAAKMNQALSSKDLTGLKGLARHLEGLSGGIGAQKVQELSRRITPYADGHDENDNEIAEGDALKHLIILVADIHGEFRDVQFALMEFYEKENIEL